MESVERITVLWPVGPCGYGNQVAVLASEFDRVTAEREALQLMLNDREEQLHSLEQRRYAEQQAREAAERRVEELAGLLEYMLSEDDMPVHWFAQRIDAALNHTAEAVSHDRM
jgi:chromosome segregation ATPase